MSQATRWRESSHVSQILEVLSLSLRHNLRAEREINERKRKQSTFQSILGNGHVWNKEIKALNKFMSDNPYK